MRPILLKPIVVAPKPADVLAKNRAEMQSFLSQMLEANQITLKEAMNRNIIFVGKSRSGKSTALSVLKNPFTFVRMSSLFSETKDAAINHFTVELAPQEKGDLPMNFNVSIIDTPGLFEVSETGSGRNNDALEALVLKCMQSEITKIHAIFFVVAYGSQGINPQDILALEEFINLFEGAQNHVHVLVTKCEKLGEKEKTQIQEEFKRFPKMADLLKRVHPKMYFLGAVEQSDYEKGHVDSFKATLPNVLQMRQELFVDIFMQEDHFELKSLAMVDSVRGKATLLFRRLKSEFANKESLPSDFRANCKTLGGWLPLLEVSSYNEANAFLVQCETFFKQN